jgi:hypothetical protein
MSYHGRPKLHLPTLAIVMLGLLLPGCGGSRDATMAKDEPVLGGAEKPSALSRATTRSESLTVTLTTTRTRVNAGSPVEFDLSAYAPHAPGAFGYQLRYGDGTSTAQEAVPLICLAGKGVPMRQTWHLVHRYKAASRYRVSVSVYVNCTRDQALAHITVIVT